MSTKIEEVVGLVSGLAAVVKDQQTAAKDVTSETQKQIQDLSKAVHDLSQSLRSKDTSSSPLRLPQLCLPEFTGKENLNRFAEQLTNVLLSSGVSPKFWFTYLKQQCQKDARAFDIICTFERTNASQLTDKSTPDEYGQFYDRCLALLLRQRGIPKEEQIRQLLATYYAMSQHPTESVSGFSHRFLETQHCLEKLIPGIHRSSDSGAEIELIHAFTMKLKPEIAKELFSRKTAFKDLTAVIEAAKRYESVEKVLPHLPSPSSSQDDRLSWKPEAHFTSANRLRADQDHDTKPKQNFSKQNDNRGNVICRNYDYYHNARCDLPNNKCSNGFAHKCSKCYKPNCKSRFHIQSQTQSFQRNAQCNSRRTGQSNSPQSDKSSPSSVNGNNVAPSEATHSLLVNTVKEVVGNSFETLKKDLTSSIEAEVKRQLPPTQVSQSPVATP